jgi:hypothetical protein
MPEVTFLTELNVDTYLLVLKTKIKNKLIAISIISTISLVSASGQQSTDLWSLKVSSNHRFLVQETKDGLTNLISILVNSGELFLLNGSR